MSDVFISYSKVDRRQAEALAEDLKLHGYSVWWDTNLYGGEDFHDVILQALDAAKVAIVIWSEPSVKSQWVRGEAQHAQSQQKLKPTKFSKLRDADIPLNFRTLHTEPLEDRDRILRAVERLVGRRRRATTAETRVEPAILVGSAASAEKAAPRIDVIIGVITGVIGAIGAINGLSPALLIAGFIGAMVGGRVLGAAGGYGKPATWADLGKILPAMATGAVIVAFLAKLVGLA